MKYIKIPNDRIKLPLKNWQDLQNYFPYDNPRKYQAEVISVIDHFISKDVTDIIVNMPTGIGKSGVAAAMVKKYGGAIYTPTLGLTAQYAREFNWLQEVKGRGNFECRLPCNSCKAVDCKIRKKGRKCTAETAYCAMDKDFKCPLRDECGYYIQRDLAIESDCRLSSPQYAFNAIKADERWHTDVAIFDEAHKLTDILMNAIEINITHKDFSFVYGRNISRFRYDLDDNEEWKEMLETFKKTIDDNIVWEKAPEIGHRYELIWKKVDRAISLLDDDLAVVDYDGKKITIRPVIVGKYGKEMLDSLADVRIYLSGTLFNPSIMVKDLGLDDGNVLYVDVTESPFPDANKDIVPVKSAYMGYGKIDKNMDKINNDVLRILDHHRHERGVILANSHKLREAIQARMPKRVITFSDNKMINCPVCGSGYRDILNGNLALCKSCGSRYIYRNRDAQLDKFLTKLDEPLVLNNVYTMEGFDFGTNKESGKRIASFMIVVKIPYPPVNDRFIAARMRYEQTAFTDTCDIEAGDDGLCKRWDCQKCKGWYLTQTMNKLIQMSGRIIRSKDDTGTIYILDKGWGRFYSSVEHLMPRWFKNSIRFKPRWL